MLQRGVLAKAGNHIAREFAERPAGSGEMYPGYFVPAGGLEALEDGGMLRVYGKDIGIVFMCGGHHYRPRRNEGFLICKGYAFPGFQGSQSGFKPAEANHGGNYDVDIGTLYKGAGGIDSAVDIPSGESVTERRIQILTANYNFRNIEFQSLLCKKFRTAVGRYHLNLEQVRVLTHNVQRLGAYRPCGAKNRYLFHLFLVVKV
jgi:hypothetical protein